MTRKPPKISPKKWLLLFAILIATFSCLVYIWKIFLADTAFSRGETLKELGLYEQAITEFQRASRLNFYEPRYHRELAYNWAILALNTQDTSLKENYINQAAKEAQTAYSLNPRNSLTLRSIINTYFELSKERGEYQAIAEDLVQEAINFIPTDPVLRYIQGKIFTQGEKYEAALNSFDEAIKIKADYREAKYAKGLVLATQKRYEEAVKIFEEIGDTEKAEKYRELIPKGKQ